MAKTKKPKQKKTKPIKCEACGMMMCIAGGYAGTGLCGPCATGESSTIDEIGDTW